MVDKLIKVTIKATKESMSGFSNFYVDSDDVDSPFKLVEKFVAWFNDEFGENFQIRDLGNIENYRPDRIGEENEQ